MKRLLINLVLEAGLLAGTVYLFVLNSTICKIQWLAENHIAMGIASLAVHIWNLLCAYVIFSKRTNFYSRKNCRQKAYFDPKTSALGRKEEGKYSILVKETEKGIWQIEDDIQRQFILTGYLCPKAYICAYFIRQLHFVTINKLKYPVIKLFFSLDLRPWEKYNYLEICFQSKGKQSRKILVRNCKTKVTWLIHLVLRARYYVDFMSGVGIGVLRRKCIYLTEEKYLNRDLV